MAPAPSTVKPFVRAKRKNVYVRGTEGKRKENVYVKGKGENEGENRKENVYVRGTGISIKERLNPSNKAERRSKRRSKRSISRRKNGS